jgi:hypothetical protein
VTTDLMRQYKCSVRTLYCSVDLQSLRKFISLARRGRLSGISLIFNLYVTAVGHVMVPKAPVHVTGLT